MAAPRELIAEGFYAKKQLYLKDVLISWSHRRRFETGLQLVSRFQPRHLLDYGCGDGTFLAMLAQSNVCLQEAAGCELLETVVDCGIAFAQCPTCGSTS